MKRLFIIMVGFCLCIGQGFGQNNLRNQLHSDFQQLRQNLHKEFESLRAQNMREYVEFVRKTWKEFESVSPVPVPHEKTLPPVPFPQEELSKPIKDKPVFIDEVIEAVVIAPQPQPIQPIEKAPVKNTKYLDFTFFGTAAKVRFDKDFRVALKSVDENSVADALQAMSNKTYSNMLLDCLALRDKLRLSDWGYLQMLKSLTYTLAGSATNDATLLLTYLFTQSGYKARIAVHANQLYMLYASSYQIYDQACYVIDNISYYGIEELPNSLQICPATFLKEKELSLAVTMEQQFAMEGSTTRLLKSANRPDVRCTVNVNKNLIDFYNTYPTSEVGGNFMTKWAIYANTPLQTEVREQLYPALRKYIEGKSQKEAVGTLLDFVQWAFVYELDEKVWGHDRAFFAEETLYYPYADCEDRAILFSRLVRDLVGLKVVLVFYPGHLATAVQFKEPVQGDFLLFENQRYVICDPTCIGAPVGRTMSGMDNKSAKVIQCY